MSITIDTAPDHPHVPTAAASPVGPVIEMADMVIEEQRAEIELLRERLAYYQGFDAVINDNVKRSAELFRTIYDERERARRHVAQARAEAEAAATEAERRVQEERQRTQALLTALLGEADHLQRQLDAWVARLSAAIAANGGIVGSGA